MANVFERKEVEIRILKVERFVSCLNGDEITAVWFLDGRTNRKKEFREYRDFEAGDKVRAEKIGSGKYAGYDF